MSSENMREIELDGQIIKSDVPSSKNVIKFYEDVAVIHTDKGIARIRRFNLDRFIIDHLWSYSGGQYPYARVRNSKIEEICRSYGLSLEAFTSNKDLTKPLQKIYLHRYLMGLYAPVKREELKEEYQEVLKEYNLASIDELVVDHDMYDSKDHSGRAENHYTDKMRLVPRELNLSYRVGKAERVRFDILFPIGLDSVTGKHVLDLLISPSNLLKIGEVVDEDVTGRNVAELKKRMEVHYRTYITNIFKQFEDAEYKAKEGVALMKKLAEEAFQMELEGKVKIKCY